MELLDVSFHPLNTHFESALVFDSSKIDPEIQHLVDQAFDYWACSATKRLDNVKKTACLSKLEKQIRTIYQMMRSMASSGYSSEEISKVALNTLSMLNAEMKTFFPENQQFEEKRKKVSHYEKGFQERVRQVNFSGELDFSALMAKDPLPPRKLSELTVPERQVSLDEFGHMYESVAAGLVVETLKDLSLDAFELIFKGVGLAANVTAQGIHAACNSTPQTQKMCQAVSSTCQKVVPPVKEVIRTLSNFYSANIDPSIQSIVTAEKNNRKAAMERRAPIYENLGMSKEWTHEYFKYRGILLLEATELFTLSVVAPLALRPLANLYKRSELIPPPELIKKTELKHTTGAHSQPKGSGVELPAPTQSIGYKNKNTSNKELIEHFPDFYDLKFRDQSFWNAVNRQTTDMTFQLHSFKDFTANCSRRVIKLTDGKESYIVKSQRLAGTILNEVVGLELLTSLKLSQLELPKFLFMGMDRSSGEFFMAKTFIEGRTFEDMFFDIGKEIKGSLKRKELLNEFTEASRISGEVLGELQMKSMASCQTERMIQGMAKIHDQKFFILESRLQSMGLPNINVNKDYLDQIASSFIKDPGNLVYGLRDIHPAQYVWTPSRKMGLVDTESVMKGIDFNKNPLLFPAEELYDFMGLYKVEGISSGLTLNEIRELQHSFQTGYRSQMKADLSEAANKFCELHYGIMDLLTLTHHTRQDTMNIEIMEQLIQELNAIVK